jgi:drug/metabolite transporter (DMT)-like permease
VSIFFPILGSTLLGVLGQLVLKSGMSRLGPLSLAGQGFPSLIKSIVTNYYVIGGLLIYGAGVFFWLVALSRAPLSYAYPFASLSYVLVTMAAFFLLREKIGLLRLVGVMLICSGVIVVAFS